MITARDNPIRAVLIWAGVFSAYALFFWWTAKQGEDRIKGTYTKAWDNGWQENKKVIKWKKANGKDSKKV